MLSQQSIEQYRAMSPRERFEIYLGLLRLAGRSLAIRDPEHIRRAEDAVRKERDLSAEYFFRHLDSLR